MKGAVGVPVAGGHPDAFVRERASATPTRRKEADRARNERRSAPEGRPVRAPLGQLQEWFARAVMHPVSVTAAVEETTLGGESIGAGDVERVVLPSSRLSGVERIEIYHDAYRARLVECLADDYPALQSALGESPFEALCLAYVAEHPSRSPNLNFFGCHMSEFCRRRGSSVPEWSADLAALEWALVEVIHAAPVESPSEEALAKIAPADWPRARFTPSDAVRVLEFDHAVNAYFQAYNTGADVGEPERGWSATAVFRDGATIWRMDMSRPMHALLVALVGGVPLGEALDALASSGALREEEAPLVMGWFRDWVKYGFFASIAVPS
jgi:hypothetical protein